MLSFQINLIKICVICAAVSISFVSGQQYGSNRAQTIHNIFQIPIQTLTAVSNVVENTRPIGDVIQQRIMRLSQLQQSFSGQTNYLSNTNSNRRYSSRAAQIADVPLAPDGSGFRI